MTHPDSSISTRPRLDDARGALGVPLELRPGQAVQLRGEPVTLRLDAIVADSRTQAEPGDGSCTVRLTLVPERGETSTFYLSLDREAPQLASVSAFGYRVTLRDVTRTPASDTPANDGRRATVVLAHAVESSH